MSGNAKKTTADARTEQAVIDQLRAYKRVIARIKILERHPAGNGMELKSIRQALDALDAEDAGAKRELLGQIAKAIEARSGARTGFDELIDRIGELQELEKTKGQTEWALDVMEEYKPDYGKLLRMEFVQHLTPAAMMDELGISRSTFYAWRLKAFEEYAAITGIRGKTAGAARS